MIERDAPVRRCSTEYSHEYLQARCFTDNFEKYLHRLEKKFIKKGIRLFYQCFLETFGK